MKFIFLIFIFISMGCSTNETTTPKSEITEPALILTKLGPVNPRGDISLGRLNVSLIRENEIVISKDSENFGDCKSCVRGFSVENYIDVKFEGPSFQDLKVSRKQSPDVKIVDCVQSKVVSKEFKCVFEVTDKIYTLNFLLKNNEF